MYNSTNLGEVLLSNEAEVKCETELRNEPDDPNEPNEPDDPIENEYFETSVFLMNAIVTLTIIGVHLYYLCIGSPLAPTLLSTLFMLVVCLLNFIGYDRGTKDSTFPWVCQPFVLMCWLLIYVITIRETIYGNDDDLRIELACYVGVLFALDLLQKYECSLNIWYCTMRVLYALAWFLMVRDGSFLRSMFVYILFLSPQIIRVSLVTTAACGLCFFDLVN